MKSLALAAVLPALFGTAQAALPASVADPNQPWISLSPDLQFQAGKAKNPANAARLAAAQRRFLNNYNHEYVQESPFADSYETFYTAYSQTWRLLGFYSDCSSVEEGGEQRALSEDEENGGCTLKAIWAAYADLGYEGNGLSEYKMYDPHAGQWDSSGCEADDDDENRCVKMDCHLEGTEFELLGMFMEPSLENWFGQLFKHEGYCIWTGDEYDFMQDARESWPEGCSQSYISGLYYSAKPVESGGMGIGAYTDSLCTQESSNEEISVSDLTGGSIDQDFIDTWNAYLSIYTICQPCIAYVPGWMSNYQDGSQDSQDRRLEGEGNGSFECGDAAGYTNVNQCMKFNSQTYMTPITDYDLMKASVQGGLAHIPDVHSSVQKNQARITQASAAKFRAPAAFWIGLGYLAVAVLVAGYARVRSQSKQGSMNQPLIFRASDDVVV
jgi:hypothetical protein